MVEKNPNSILEPSIIAPTYAVDVHEHPGKVLSAALPTRGGVSYQGPPGGHGRVNLTHLLAVAPVQDVVVEVNVVVG